MNKPNARVTKDHRGCREIGLRMSGRVPWRNLRTIFNQHLDGGCGTIGNNLLKGPEAAARDHILTVLIMVRKLFLFLKRIIGDPSDAERVLVGLDLRSRKADL